MKFGTFILVPFLAAIMLFSSLRVTLTYAYYYLDPADFIERLCENKDKPELKCDGKCHLKKVVRNNTNDDQAPAKAISFKEINLFVVEQMKYDFIEVSIKKMQPTNYNNLYTFISAYQFYHPPQV